MKIERNVLTAKEIMTTSVISLSPDTDIFDAIEVLTSRKISGAPVLDEEGHLAGVLSEKDCLRVLAGESFFEGMGGHVSDFMTAEVTTVTPETDIFSIAGIFLSNAYRRVPVCDGPRLVGIISRRDVLTGISTMQKQLTPKQYPDYRGPQ